MPETGLSASHRRLGARFTSFAGWTLPLDYGSILREVRHVRQRAGLFDLGHMGEIEVAGPGASACVQRLTTNDVSRLGVGAGQYTLMCREDGGILDDLIVYRLEAERYLLVVNAVNRDRDREWIQHWAGEVQVADRSAETGLVALQGPAAASVLGEFVAAGAFPSSFGIRRLGLMGEAVWVARTGYTGEDGFEIFGSWDLERVWWGLLEGVQAAGGGPCGLGARDILRIEAGYCLYGAELSETRDPYAAGLGWAVRLGKGDFIGRRALERIRSGSGPVERRGGLRWAGRGIVRAGACFETQWGCGVVTSGTFSPTLGCAIGMGYAPARREGDRVVAVTGRAWLAGREGVICRLPFSMSGGGQYDM